jgi:methanogenic corrinoid protein MtbC1
VIEHAKATGKRDEFFVMVGGASTSPAWAQEIGADGHGETAADAVALAEAYLGRVDRR